MGNKLKKELKEITGLLCYNLIEFKVVLPLWLILFLFLILFIAYADFIIFAKFRIWDYAKATFLEIVLVFIGFTIAKTNFKKYKGKKK